EFGVLLSRADEGGAMLVGERIRSALEAHEVVWSEGSLRFTASVGAAEIVLRDNHLEAPLDRADKALYEAKQTGRNKVVAFSSLGSQKWTPDL
ncbi:MAG: GGDEF domain-containing protein, partial [Bdellovibrionales bacterium]